MASLNIPGVLEIKGISYETLPTLTEDSQFVGDILRHFFIDREVMWQDMSKEKVPKCIRSLQDLVTQCDEKATELGRSKKEKDVHFADMLKAWKSRCIEAMKDFERAVEYESIGRKIEFDSEFVMKAEESIPLVLGKFRGDSYPIVSAFIELMPEQSQTRKDAERRLERGKEVLIRDYKLTPSRILAAEWTVTI